MAGGKQNRINRRNFLKTAGGAGLASVLAPAGGFAEQKDTADKGEVNVSKEAEESKFPQVPRRKLGKTGIKVPCLAVGAMFDTIENQITLRKTLQWGVNLWDTAHSYTGGKSERGIGKFLERDPEVRKKLIIATKASDARTVADVEKRLETSLKRMNTGYIDIYYGIHDISGPSQLTDELKDWAKSAKKRGLIRFFGFTTHENMAKHLAAAAKLDWIDVIMASYNFRLMQDPELLAAVEACNKAGIGLIAMKVTGLRSWYRYKIESEADKKMVRHFLQRGFTETQATIKVVLEDKRISSACIGMQNIAHLTANVAATLDKTKLTQRDRQVFREYAQATCSGYCAGCSDICRFAVPEGAYISKVMRYLMYYNSYGDEKRARELFAQIPAGVRNKLAIIDYSPAEARCPQHLPIGELMAEAMSKLA